MPPRRPLLAGGLAQQMRQELREVLFSSKLNVLLVCLPLAVVSRFVGWSGGVTFCLSTLALCPLAERLGFVTEQLALYTNETLGGLLNASFGNATELIISGFALRYGYLRVVQLSLLGSILSNLLLVLGSALLAGGLRFKQQSFNQAGMSVNVGLLMLCLVAIALPSVLDETGTAAGASPLRSELWLSRFESLFMLACYGLFLLFQLKTHRHLYEEVRDSDDDDEEEQRQRRSPARKGGNASGQQQHQQDSQFEVELNRLMGGGAGPSAALGGGGGSSATAGSRGSGVVAKSSYLHGSSSHIDRASALEHGAAAVAAGGGGSSHTGSVLGTPHKRNSASGEAHGSAASVDGDDVLDWRTGVAGGGGGDGVVAGANGDSDGDDGDDDELVLSKAGSFVWLALITALIALLSEFVVGAIEAASKSLRLPLPFLTTIVLPIFGNAAEHASAVVFAWRNKLDV